MSTLCLRVPSLYHDATKRRNRQSRGSASFKISAWVRAACRAACLRHSCCHHCSKMESCRGVRPIEEPPKAARRESSRRVAGERQVTRGKEKPTLNRPLRQTVRSISHVHVENCPNTSRRMSGRFSKRSGSNTVTRAGALLNLFLSIIHE